MLDNEVKEMKQFCDNNGYSCKGCKYVKLCQTFTRANEMHKTPSKHEFNYILDELKKCSNLRVKWDRKEWTNKGGKYSNSGRDRFSKFYSYIKFKKCKYKGMGIKEEWKEFQTFMEWLHQNYNGEKYIIIKEGVSFIDENAIIFTNTKKGLRVNG